MGGENSKIVILLRRSTNLAKSRAHLRILKYALKFALVYDDYSYYWVPVFANAKEYPSLHTKACKETYTTNVNEITNLINSVINFIIISILIILFIIVFIDLFVY